MVKITHKEELETAANDEDGGKSSPKSPKPEKKHVKKDVHGDDKPIYPESGLTIHHIEEILFLLAADYPGMQLIFAPLTGANFLNWSRSIKRALAARSKIELLDGTFPEPSFESPYYKRWLKVYYMVSTWICYSISKELVDAFSHIDTTYKLWSALSLHFGGSNGPKILKLQREIYAFTQGNLSVAMYFNQLNSLWDEMDMLLPPLNCICHARRKSIQRTEQTRLVGFLVGLNEAYESTKTQIMILKPLPSLDQAYSMVIEVEDQKRLIEQSNDGRNIVSMNVKKSTYGNAVQFGGNKQSFQKPTYQKQTGGPFKRRISKEEKRKLKCSHCQAMGHEADECFNECF